MARPSGKHVYVLVYGRKLIAAFFQKQNAEKALDNLKMVVPQGYPVKPSIIKTSIQG